MEQMIQDFIKQYNPLLTTRLREYINDNARSDNLMIFLNDVVKNWNKIPINIDEYPYVEHEKEFWFAFHQLYFILVVNLTPKRKEILENGLPETLDILEGNKQLPNECDAVRPAYK